MHARAVREKRELLEIETAWNELIRDSYFDAPFYSWAWHHKWWEHFGNEHELFIIVVQDSDGALQAIAPLRRRKTRLRGLRANEICFLYNYVAPRSSILVRNGSRGLQAVRAIIEYLSRQRVQWDQIRLEDIDEGMPYLSALCNQADSCGLHTIATTGRRSPFVTIGTDFRKYTLDTLRGERRRSIKHKVNRLLKRTDYRFMEFTEPEQMQTAIDLAFRVSKASWKGEKGSDMSGSAPRKAFYIDITDHFARLGQIKVWISFLGDNPIAVQYQLTNGQVVYMLISDFDERYRSLSPGTVLLYQIMEKLHDTEVNEFDFSGNCYEYKTKWATGLRRHVTLEIFHNGAYSYFIFLTKKRILPMLRSVRSNVVGSWRRFLASE